MIWAPSSLIVQSAYPDRAGCPHADVGNPTARGGCSGGSGETVTDQSTRKERSSMLWLVIGIVLLVIAIAGGAIVHPILFALGILALLAFVVGGRGGGRRTAL
jgi:predicted nucleic acid-binding Zn ribbon protein